jgi:hypothetical protein
MFRIASILGVFVMSGALSAQNFSFPNFSTVSGLTLNQNAVQLGSALRLTASVASQRGTAFWNNPVSVALGFETTFTFQVTALGGGGGADGLAFIIHNDPRGVLALGNHASAIGYGAFPTTPTGTAIANSLVVEFDMFQGIFNGIADLSSNEISVHTGGTGDNSQGEDHSIGRANAPVNMKNGAVHTATIRYVPGTLSVLLNNIPVLSVPYNFDTGGQYILGTALPVPGLSLFAGGLATIGFGASCGGAYENHDILSWTYTSLANDPCFAGTVGVGSGGPFDVLSINGGGIGSARRAVVPVGGAFNVDLSLSPVTNTPANFIIVGMIGLPDLQSTYPTPFGTFCFPPAPLAPAPNLFVLADSYNLGLGALVPATATPWTLSQPSGIGVPVTLAIQGIMDNGFGSFELTNAVVLEVL